MARADVRFGGDEFLQVLQPESRGHNQGQVVVIPSTYKEVLGKSYSVVGLSS